jgi:hypothetical protein
MRIHSSKYKDYFDYLQGIYGIDDKLILTRNNKHIDHLRSSLDQKHTYSLNYFFNVYIGRYVISAALIDKQFVTGEDLDKYKKKSRKPHPYLSSYDIPEITSRRTYGSATLLDLGDKSLTWKYDCPVIVEASTRYHSDVIFEDIILSDLKIPSLIPAEEVWIMLSDWLGKRVTKNEPEVPVGTNNDRIISAGFDLKTSFRK